MELVLELLQTMGVGYLVWRSVRRALVVASLPGEAPRPASQRPDALTRGFSRGQGRDKIRLHLALKEDKRA